MGEHMKYIVVVEKGESSHGAHVPDLPGCIAVSETREEVLKLIKEAIDLHIEGLRKSGKQSLLPRRGSAYVEVKAA